MKVPALILSIFMAAVAAGQVLTAKDDISAEKYHAAERKADELLNTANYRSVWTEEIQHASTKKSFLLERKVTELILPDKQRFYRETFFDGPLRYEVIWIKPYTYSKLNDEPWKKGNVTGHAFGIYDGKSLKTQYKFIPNVDLEGKVADLYEQVVSGTTEYMIKPKVTVVKYVRTTRSWYAPDGKLLKKVEEKAVENSDTIRIFVTTYEYDPKDLKIEAPIK